MQISGQKPVREYRTYDRKKYADIWMKKREFDIRQMPDPRPVQHKGATLADTINSYLKWQDKRSVGTKRNRAAVAQLSA